MIMFQILVLPFRHSYGNAFFGIFQQYVNNNFNYLEKTQFPSLQKLVITPPRYCITSIQYVFNFRKFLHHTLPNKSRNRVVVKSPILKNNSMFHIWRLPKQNFYITAENVNQMSRMVVKLVRAYE